MKIAVHSEDIDGISCAALFLLKYPNAEIKFLSVYEAENTDEEFDFAADLPKTKNSKINIDHHETNYVKLIKDGRISEKDLIDPAAPSAALLVMKYLNLESNKIAQEIVDIANKADTGKFDAKTRLLDKVIKLNIDNNEALRKIAEALAKFGKNYEKDPWLATQLRAAKEIMQRYESVINRTLRQLLSKKVKYAIFDATSIPFFMAKDLAQLFARKGGYLGVSVYIDPVTKSLRCSIRVSDSCNIKANKITEKLGGGGHEKASGALIKNISELIEQIIEHVEPNEFIAYVKVRVD